ncbi:hypothetical protein N7491_006210 [Penicillium cf. griseofulvum]|uniref:SMP-30/Gluconolactonase/LRE-like region domain-containing protein n=1 Tax=Penicillium cf. griseofulvum TaxID=2972120 RepID=A0A9W9M1Q1_9EURO|nr:hypothetical protein N7472_010760 [Penicillium cf. griseofulvum]KAJ5429194.1 hypothetical protein N7491_006210 [Penicillium cf. griseofulvum]KAJ5437014.1 hypothetical protein N7445_007899 [Penicillium cf. griseofulvum]
MANILNSVLLLLTIIQTLCLAHSPNLREIHRFPNGTWVENIAVRPNGNLLVAVLSTAELWEIDPSIPSGPSSARLVHHFDGAEDADGITELSPDIYAVIASNSAWTIDLRGHGPAKPSLIAKLPAGYLNGIAALDEGNAVAITDSQLGIVWYLNIRTGSYNVIHQHETMTANNDMGLLLGVNGLKIVNGYMYYSNSPKRIFCRVRIDTHTGRALGSYEVISNDTRADDFAIGPHGVGYLAGLVDNVVIRVFPNGHHEVIAGSEGSTDLMTATSTAFGRTQRDSNVLYITTGGETKLPVRGTSTRGGKVMALSVEF